MSVFEHAAGLRLWAVFGMSAADRQLVLFVWYLRMNLLGHLQRQNLQSLLGSGSVGFHLIEVSCLTAR